MSGTDSMSIVQTPNEPVLVRKPYGGSAVPLVYDSPHSGRQYPPDFIPAMPVEQLHGYEDRLVDDLLRDASDHGIILVAANFPRSYIDPNRAIDDLDPQVVGEDWTGRLAPTAYSELGLGLVFRAGLDGKPIYERPLGRATVLRRIEKYWQPYHDALEAALMEARDRWGAVWHIAWHSMRPVGDAQSADPGQARPDFVVSDRDGDSAEAAFTQFAVEALIGLGYSVAVNHPFKGGYITEKYGRPEEGLHSLQVEINRALYLDLETLELASNASAVRADLDLFSRRLVAFASDRAGTPAATRS